MKNPIQVAVGVGLAVVAGVGVGAATGWFGEESAPNDHGDIVEAGGLDAFVLDVGDCFVQPDGDLIASVEGMPCDEPHDAEVYESADIDADDFPGEDAIQFRANEACYDGFEPYVGVAYEVSALEISWLVPTEKSWHDTDDRTITCIAVTADGSRRTGTVRNAEV